MPATLIDQPKPQSQPQATSPAASVPSGGATLIDPPTQQSTGGSGQQTAQPSQGWGIDWSKGGEVTMPQSVQDWGNIAGNEAMMGTLPGLRTQADAASKRLDPVTAASANLVGGVLSPTNLLNALPGGAPIAGALHEGIRSYNQGNDWRTIADDAAGGALLGKGAQWSAALAPKVAPIATRVAVQGGIPTVLGAIGHSVFGHGDAYRELAHMVPEFASIFALDEAAKSTAAKMGNALNTPAARQALQSVILGGGAAARQGAGQPFDQWMTGP